MKEFEVTEVRNDGPKYGSADTSVGIGQDSKKITQFRLPITQRKVPDIFLDLSHALASPTASLDFRVILAERCVLK